MAREFKLGDVVEKALKAVGVTEERVRKVIPNCGCRKRREMLNRLSLWAQRVVSGKTEDAEKYLDEIVGEAEKKVEWVREEAAEGEKSAMAPDANGGRPA